RPLSPRRGSEARNTSSATTQSFSVIFVDIADLQISRLSMNQTNLLRGILATILAAIRPHSLGCAGLRCGTALVTQLYCFFCSPAVIPAKSSLSQRRNIIIGIYGADGFTGRHMLQRLAAGKRPVPAISRHIVQALINWYDNVQFVEAALHLAVALVSPLR